MINRLVLVFLLYGVFSNITFGQNNKLRVVFWNLENLFDTRDDTLKLDNEFLPESKRHWDNHRFYKKLNNTYKVIIGIGEWDPPAMIGLCEVENRYVLNQLIYETPLKNFNYGIVHYESPDRRGIDVAFLYRKSIFTIDTSLAVSIRFPFDPGSRTRDILYIRGRIITGDTLHLYVNHWPSRYGGYLETKPKRNFVAEILKSHTDSLFRFNPSAKIIVMGDFNDDPTDESISQYLMTFADTLGMRTDALYNLMALNKSDNFEGTLKYQQDWNTFDQFIVSGSLMYGSSLLISNKKASIFHPGYLLEPDDKFLGSKPFRTYSGFKYNGGFSDHLPVYLDLIYNDQTE
ncbi:MAG: endonuclease [Bacteroidales bacterium]|nr:endonuclease [Bacteroidales bacterium]